MFGQTPLNEMLFFMLYGGAMAIDTFACLYLLLRRGNVFAPDVTSPLRLRHWTAVFFASLALGHLWYMPAAVVTSSDDDRLYNLIGGMLDCMTLFPLAIVILLCMLQDRRRPLWPAWVMVVPVVAGLAVCMADHSYVLLPTLRIYLLLLGIGLIIYMVREVRQYGRWLRDNYADLEHKEVWRSFLVLVVILLMFGIYVGGYGSMANEFIVQFCDILLVCYLLWRVETLSDLSISPSLPIQEETTMTDEQESDDEALSPNDDIEPLLQRHCIDAQLYLQHDLTVTQLAQVLGTNRFYLSQYFAHKETTYNAYINNLRIQHFTRLYREAVADQRPISAKQLASDSGYRSYSTFSLAFKQRTGHSVTAWMRNPT